MSRGWKGTKKTATANTTLTRLAPLAIEADPGISYWGCSSTAQPTPFSLAMRAPAPRTSKFIQQGNIPAPPQKNSACFFWDLVFFGLHWVFSKVQKGGGHIGSRPLL